MSSDLVMEIVAAFPWRCRKALILIDKRMLSFTHSKTRVAMILVATIVLKYWTPVLKYWIPKLATSLVPRSSPNGHQLTYAALPVPEVLQCFATVACVRATRHKLKRAFQKIYIPFTAS